MTDPAFLAQLYRHVDAMERTAGRVKKMLEPYLPPEQTVLVRSDSHPR